MAWDKPIVGVSFPPNNDKPCNHEDYLKLIDNGDHRLGSNVWVHVGSLQMKNCMVFYQKHHAEMYTSRLPGSYVEERGE
jgi:hypothetical protein